MKKTLLILLVFSFAISCSKDEDEPEKHQIEGYWLRYPELPPYGSIWIFKDGKYTAILTDSSDNSISYNYRDIPYSIVGDSILHFGHPAIGDKPFEIELKGNLYLLIDGAEYYKINEAKFNEILSGLGK